MKLVYGGILATSTLIFFGVLVISPVYDSSARNPKTIFLSFNITDENNLPVWCKEIGEFANNANIQSTIFITGKIAEKYPQCVTSFGPGFDIGSLTYSGKELPSIPDYLIQLEEVKAGKSAIDSVGKIDSRLFRAPNGVTNENIYSLLERNEILADFSYNDRYHKFHESQFLWFKLSSYDGSAHSPSYFFNLKPKHPIQIYFDNTVPAKKIIQFISELRSHGEIHFVNASELTGIDLTLRSFN